MFVKEGRNILNHFFVDDLLIMGKGEKCINESKLKLCSKILSNDMGEETDYFGMKIIQVFKPIIRC